MMSCTIVVHVIIKAPNYPIVLYDLLIATVGREIPPDSSTYFLIETLNFETISGYLLQNPLKLITSLLYKNPCLI